MRKVDMAKEATKIYRLALPKNANSEQRHSFEKQVLAIRQVNPGWVVMNDWAKPGEKEAVVIVRKNQNYPYSRALYLAKSHLVRTIARGYGDKL